MMRFKKFVETWLVPPGVGRLLAEAPPALKRLWGGVAPEPDEVISLDPTGIAPAGLREIRIAKYDEIVWVPVEKIRMWGRGLTREQNQFVRYFGDGFPSLRRFYELHQPANQMEALFIDTKQSGSFIPVRFPRSRAPWSFETTFAGELGLGPEHGGIGFGPVSEEKLLMEKKRLDHIRARVQEQGFLKLSTYDFIFFGRLLVHDSDNSKVDYRVLCGPGQHRVSLAAFLGWPIIPMAAPHHPLREVRLSQASDWPGVLDGTYSLKAAQDYFLAHFRDQDDVLIPDW